MWQELKLLTKEFFETQRNQKLGFCIGMGLGAAVMAFGFFNTMFSLGCGMLGLYVGSKIDNGDDFFNKTLEKLDAVLSSKLRR